MYYAGGANYIVDRYVYYDEIFTYNSALNTWNITGRLREPRAWHVVATTEDKSKIFSRLL